MKITIGNNVYNGDRKFADKCIQMAKEKYEKENAFGLYALEKEDVVQMMRLTFTNSIQLMDAVKSYEENGFKCYYTEHLKKGDPI